MNKFFTKIAGLTLGLATAIGVGVAVGSKSNEVKPAYAAQSWAETTSTFSLASSIASGDKIIIAAANYNVAMGAQNGTYVKYAKDITKSQNGSSATVDAASSVLLLTVGTSSIENTAYYTFNDGNGYLTNTSDDTASKNKNRISTQASLDTTNGKTHWTVSISNGVASITSYGQSSGSTRKTMSYNLNGDTGDHLKDRFSCYTDIQGTGQLAIYKKVTVPADKIDDSSNPFTVSATPTVSRGDSLPAVSGWTVTAKLVDKDTPASITSGLTIVGTPSTNTVGSISVTLRYTAASGQYSLNSGAATYDISTTMTVNPVQAQVAFKQDTYTIAPSNTLTLSDEITQSGDGDLTFSIVTGGEYVSISNGVLTANALGTATIKVVKQYSTYTAFKAEDTATISVSNVATWAYTFTSKIYSGEGTQTLEGTTNIGWTLAIDSEETDPYYGYDTGTSDRGQQFGSGSSLTTRAALSTKGFESVSEIQTVKVEAAIANGSDATLSVSVGNEAYSTLVNSSSVTSVALTTTSTVYIFTGESNGEIEITLSQTTKKGMYIKSIQVIYDNSPITQTGIKASWADGKGSYYNGSITATTTFSTQHLVINTTTGDGKIYGDANTSGAGFITYLKNSVGKWVKTDKTTSDTEVAFIDATSALGTQAMTGFEAGTYSLYVTTAKDGGGVWTSDTINFVVVAKAPATITRASEPSKTEYIAYVDTFSAFSGKINVVYNDTATNNNRTPVIKYYNGDSEVDISTLLNASNKFAVNSNTTLTVRLYDTGFVGGDYVYDSYSMYIYAGTFTCTDGNGSGAEYESGATVALNPSPKISYTDKDSTAQVLDLTVSDVNLYIKLKNASGDGDAYSGTLPEVNEATDYTITAVYKGNSSYKASYDIEVVNATFSINTASATKSYIFGTNFTKTGLVVQIQYGSASPTIIDAANYTCEDENGNELDVIKFIGTMTVTVRYKGYSATYEITSTNVGSSETYVHDNVPGEWEAEEDASTKTYTSTTDSITDGEFDDYTLSTGSNARRFNNGAYLSANAAFGEYYVGSITITFKGHSPSGYAGATFAFTATALSDGEATTLTGTDSIVSTSSDKNIEITISGITYADAVNGWRIDCAKTNGSGNANGNLIWSSLVVKYNKFVRGPDQTFNSTPMEQALSYAAYFLEVTDEYCTVTLTTEIKTTLSNEYNGMVSAAKTLFTSATIVRGKGVTYQNDLSEALSRYVNMVEEKETGDFLSLGNTVLQKGNTNPIALTTKNASATVIVVVISAISAAAIGGYFLFRKKKED